MLRSFDVVSRGSRGEQDFNRFRWVFLKSSFAFVLMMPQLRGDAVGIGRIAVSYLCTSLLERPALLGCYM